MGCMSSKIMTRSKTFRQHLHLRLMKKTSLKVEQQQSPRTSSEDQSQKNTVTEVVPNDQEHEQSSSSSMPVSKRNDPNGSAIIHLLWLISGSEDGDDDQKAQQQLDDNRTVEELQQPMEDIVLPVTDEEPANISPRCQRIPPCVVPGELKNEEEETSEASTRNVEIWLQKSSECSLEEGILDKISEHIEIELAADSDGERVDVTNSRDSNITCSQATTPLEPDFLKQNIAIQQKNSPDFDGLKKKAKARRHKRIKTPSFEFSTVGSLREWLGFGGGVLSPGSYPTPKFGNSSNLHIPGVGEAAEIESTQSDLEVTEKHRFVVEEQEDHIFEGFEDHNKNVKSQIDPLCHPPI